MVGMMLSRKAPEGEGAPSRDSARARASRFLRPADDIHAGRREDDGASVALDQVQAQGQFQLLQADGKGGLGDVAGLRSPSKVPVLIKRHQIAELGERG